MRDQLPTRMQRRFEAAEKRNGSDVVCVFVRFWLVVEKKSPENRTRSVSNLLNIGHCYNLTPWSTWQCHGRVRIFRQVWKIGCPKNQSATVMDQQEVSCVCLVPYERHCDFMPAKCFISALRYRFDNQRVEAQQKWGCMLSWAVAGLRTHRKFITIWIIRSIRVHLNTAELHSVILEASVVVECP